MNKLLNLVSFLVIFILSGCSISPPLVSLTNNKTVPPQIVETSIVSEFGITNHTLYFPTQGQTAAVLVHDYISTRREWVEFAHHLQTKKIAAVAIEKIGRRDVLDAIKFLQQRGHKNIILVGASMGGGSAIQAANQRQGLIDKIVLLSPTDPGGLQDQTLEKLFVVAKKDAFGAATYSVYQDSAEPKVLKEYQGVSHGQNLLSGEEGKTVLDVVLKFILDK